MGRTFIDPVTLVQITTTAVAADGAMVHVAFEPDSQAPTAPGNLRTTSVQATSVALAWNASTDNVGVAGYNVQRDGTQIARVTGTTYTDATVSAANTYDYQVVAFDAAGNTTASNSLSVTTPAPDSVAPSAPGAITATVARNRTVSLSWGAATDNVAVAGYRLYRDGVLIKSVSGTSTTDRPSRGTHTYAVAAFDAAGNAGPETSSGPVVVR